MPEPPFDFVAQADEVKSHAVEFVLMPRMWKAYVNPRSGSIKWSTVPFSAGAAARIPTAKGIYGFVIHSGVAPGIANYLIYIGKAEKGLRKRFREYLSEVASPTGRPSIIYHLTKWSDHIRFWYSVLPPAEIADAEEELIKALTPPVNKSLPAEIRRAHAAFN